VDLLTAVNNILPFMQENAVTSISARHPTVALILNRIDSGRIALLTDGYWFNMETRTLYPSPEKRVAVPNNVLSMLPHDSLPYECRGDFVYNLSEGTYDITEPFKANVVVDLQFHELPLFAALALQWRAALEVYTADFSVDATAQVLKSSESEARNLLDREHLRRLNMSAARTPQGSRFLSALRG
jgi:hypothetical protein